MIYFINEYYLWGKKKYMYILRIFLYCVEYILIFFQDFQDPRS